MLESLTSNFKTIIAAATVRSLALALALAIFHACVVTNVAAQQQPQQPPATPSAQAETPQTMKLASIEFVGLARVSREEALARAGLAVGQEVSLELLDEAATRLVQSGLFKRLGYRVRGKAESASLTFEVEEEAASIPVVFDNFVWFDDEELAAAVARRVPSFDGTAPEAGRMTTEIASALQDLLRERKIEGTVEHQLSTDISGRRPEHVFTVTGARLRSCSLSFPGARTFSEEFLAQRADEILSNEYSRLYVSGFANATLLPLYHERGLLRARFLAPRVRRIETEECEGLSISIPVEEGVRYVWDRAEWTGNESLTAKELDAALAMKARDAANGLKFEKGLDAARRAYGRKGYLSAKITATPVFDDENRSVSYRMRVVEGKQYRMGRLVINGLSERDANNLRGRWSLLHGEVYDEGYLKEFMAKTVGEFARFVASEGRSLGDVKLEPELKADHEKLTVDVTLNFSPASKTSSR